MSVSNTNRWKLGLFVVTGVGLSIGALMWLGISQLQRRTEPAYFFFSESVNGLEIGAPVEFLGVELGRVEAITPAADRLHIEVQAGVYLDTLEAWGIEPGQRARRLGGEDDGMRAQLVRSALTSVAFIELGIYDVERFPPQEFSFSTPAETISTLPSTFVSFEKGLTQALEQWPEIASNAASVLARLDAGLAAMDFAALNSASLAALVEAESLMKQAAQSPVLDPDSSAMHSFSAALVEFRALLHQLGGPQGDVERAVSSFIGASEEIREDFGESDIPATVLALERAGKGFEGTSQELNLLLRELRTSLKQLDATLGSVRGLTNVLSRDPGSILHGRSPQAPFKPN